jgi:hypothetical protein
MEVDLALHSPLGDASLLQVQVHGPGGVGGHEEQRSTRSFALRGSQQSVKQLVGNPLHAGFAAFGHFRSQVKGLEIPVQIRNFQSPQLASPQSGAKGRLVHQAASFRSHGQKLPNLFRGHSPSLLLGGDVKFPQMRERVGIQIVVLDAPATETFQSFRAKFFQFSNQSIDKTFEAERKMKDELGDVFA